MLSFCAAVACFAHHFEVQLNIPLTIEEHYNDAGLFASEESMTQTKRKGTGRAYFSLNSEGRMTMNYIIYSAVEQFVKQMPDATFEDIQQYFPSNRRTITAQQISVFIRNRHTMQRVGNCSFA